MASQFQHRLVGVVVLVALGVIILPGVFDGNKKHYKSDFAAIPLIPPMETHVAGTLPPASEPLPEPVIPDPISDTGAEKGSEPTITEPPIGNTALPPVIDNPPVVERPVETQPVSPPVTQPVVPVEENNPRGEAPRGQAYVIQLGALTNAARVNEIRAVLSFANYTVFTVPPVAVQGETTRIFIGPDASRQRLEAALPELEKLTGLKGVVREHRVTN